MSPRLFTSLLLVVVCVVRGVLAYDKGEMFEPLAAIVMIFLVWLDIKNEWPVTTKEN